jgi:hypothetical protein
VGGERKEWGRKEEVRKEGGEGRERKEGRKEGRMEKGREGEGKGKKWRKERRNEGRKEGREGGRKERGILKPIKKLIWKRGLWWQGVGGIRLTAMSSNGHNQEVRTTQCQLLILGQLSKP